MPTEATGYASLQPHTAHVSRARIQKTWRPLPQPAQERVKQLLLSLQRESHAQRRSTNLRLDGRQMKKNKNKKTKEQKDHDDKEEESSEQAVREVVDKLIRRIPRMPFPRQHHNNNKSMAAGGGSSYEADFDFEATIGRIQRLEAELAETMESSKLLREQIRREEAALRADREEYKMLEAGARSEQSLAREQARKLHPVAREVDMDGADTHDDEVEDLDFDFDEREDREEGEEEREDYLSGEPGAGAVRWTTQAQKQKQKNGSNGRRSSRAGGLTKSEIEQDEQLKALVAQLRKHVNSIASNTAGLASVSDALDDAEQAIWKLMATTMATTGTTTTTTAAAAAAAAAS